MFYRTIRVEFICRNVHGGRGQKDDDTTYGFRFHFVLRLAPSDHLDLTPIVSPNKEKSP